MKRILRTALAALVAVLAATPAADAGWSHGPSAQAATDAPAYGARLAACRHGLRPEGRVAVVAATMRPVDGTRRLSLKIELHERPLVPGAPWTPRTDVPGLGSWTSPSDPTLGTRAADVYKYRQAVTRLVVGSAYRFRVAFRWLDADGAVVRDEIALTRPCRQPDLRPDLTIVRVRAHPSTRRPGLVRYDVAVRNDGRTAARGVALAASLPGEASGRVSRLGRIEPGAVAEVRVTGPGCAAGDPVAPTFQVDPAGTVDEADESDNVASLACPIP